VLDSRHQWHEHVVSLHTVHLYTCKTRKNRNFYSTVVGNTSQS
jgi:hypothetical protein